MIILSCAKDWDRPYTVNNHCLKNTILFYTNTTALQFTLNSARSKYLKRFPLDLIESRKSETHEIFLFFQGNLSCSQIMFSSVWRSGSGHSTLDLQDDLIHMSDATDKTA